MRKFAGLAYVASISLVAMGVFAATSGTSQAQAAGEVRCQDDGYIYYWNSMLGMWNNTFRKCEPGSSRSSRSRSSYNDSDDEEDNRYERRRSRRDDADEPSGQLATGDQKCSPDGYVMTYYAALKKWSKSSVRRC